ncbi:MAG: hypothetical protein AAGD96_10130 [Chloroflexota bacterium]
MRPFEIGIVIILLLAGAHLIFRSQPSFTRNIHWIFIVTAFALLLAHFLLEGFRWQMVPVYVIVAIVLIWGIFTSWNGDPSSIVRSSLVLIGFIGLSLALTLPSVLFPINTLPAPTGDFPVGTVSQEWTDSSRNELYGPEAQAPRRFVTQTWYPAQSLGSGETVDYLPQSRVTGRTLATRLGLPAFILDHLTLLNTYSYEETSPAEGEFPLLIFSHGYNSFRGQSTTLMEDLASHGYIVVSMEHTYGSALTVFPDGEIIFHNEATLEGEGEELRRTGLTLGNQWVEDIQFILDQVEAGGLEPNHPFGQADLERIGVFGHSTGGGVTLTLCGRDSRCKAAFGLDAWLGPTPDEVIESGGDPVPSFFLMSEFWPKTGNTNWIRSYLNNSSNSTWATIKQTGHYDFSDIPFLSPLTVRLGLAGGIDPYRGQEISRAFVRGFFDTHLKNEPAEYLDKPDAQFPEVLFGVPDDVSQNDVE